MDDYLDRVEAQLVALTERGAHRRLRSLAPLRPAGGLPPAGGRPPRRLRTELIALAAGFLVVAAVIGVLLGLRGATPSHPAHSSVRQRQTRHSTAPVKPTPHHRHHAASTPPASTPAAGPVPSEFTPQSFTAISEFTWWMLGTAPCSRPPCTSIVRTTNGGQSFVGIPAPMAPLISSPEAGGSGISALRFADLNDGYAYGPLLYVTHDGGQSWTPVNLGGAVTQIAISDTDVYALIATSGGGGRLMRSPTDADNWTQLPVTVSGYGGLSVYGPDVFAQDGPKLALSRDGGATFTGYPAPSDLPCDFEEPVAPVVWAHCATGTESSVWRSTDGGRTFTAPGSSSGGVSVAPEPNSAVFAAATDATAVVGYQQLYRTTDGGARYRPVGPQGLTWEYLGFTDTTHGVALGYPTGSSPSAGQLWYTTDAGATYHLVGVN